MNTKGMKFLAVLAVLAMAFAAFAVVSDLENNDATDATATATLVDGTYTFTMKGTSAATDLTMVQNGTTLKFSGLIKTPATTGITDYGTITAPHGWIQLTGFKTTNVYKISQTNSALKDAGVTSGTRTTSVWDPGTTTGVGDSEKFMFLIPTDGSKVDLTMYVKVNSDDTQDKDWTSTVKYTLDFSEVYTKVTLSTSPYTGVNWSYSYESSKGTLTLDNATLNTWFYSANAIDVILKGTNKITTYTDQRCGAIGTNGSVTLTVKSDSTTKGTLEVVNKQTDAYCISATTGGKLVIGGITQFSTDITASGTNRALYTTSEAADSILIDNAKLNLSGSERVIRSEGTLKVDKASEITCNISGSGVNNLGQDDVMGIKTKDINVVDAASVVKTQGMRLTGTDSTATNAGKIFVSGDYTQNPGTSLYPAISGLYIDDAQSTMEFIRVDSISSGDAAGKKYIVGDAETFGDVVVKDTGGKTTEKTTSTANASTAQTAAKELESSADLEEVTLNLSGGSALAFTEEVKIPAGKVLRVITATGGDTALTGTLNVKDQKITLTAVKGSFEITPGSIAIIGTITGGTLTIATAGETLTFNGTIGGTSINVVGGTDIKLEGTINGAVSITSTDGKAVTVSVESGKTLTITGSLSLDQYTTMNVSGTVTGPIFNNGKIVIKTGGDITGATISGTGSVTNKSDESEMSDIYVNGDSDIGTVTYPAKQNVIVNGAWNLIDGATIIIKGALYVPEGAKLTVESGATLVIENDAEVTIEGTLLVEDYDSNDHVGAITLKSGKISVEGTFTMNGVMSVQAANQTSGSISITSTGIATIGKNAILNMDAGTSLTVQSEATLTVMGALNTNTIYNYGTIVIATQIAATGDSTIYMRAGNAIVDVQKFTIGESKKTLTVSDEGLVFWYDKSEGKSYGVNLNMPASKINSVVLSATNATVATDHVNVITGITITEKVSSTTTKPSSSTSYYTQELNGRWYDNRMSVEGEIEVARAYIGTGTVSPSYVAAATVTLSGLRGINIDAETTLDAGLNVTLVNAANAKLAVKGDLDVLDTTTLAGNSNATYTNNGTITVSGSGLASMSSEITTGTKNATLLEKGTSEKTYYYMSLDSFIAAANADPTITEGNVYGSNSVSTTATLPENVTITLAAEATVTIGSSSKTDVVLTIDDDATVKGSGTIDVKGTLYAEDKTDVKGNTIISDVYTCQMDEKGKAVKNGWAIWTNLITALNTASAGDIITIGKVPSGDKPATMNVVIAGNVEIKEGVTLIVPENAAPLYLNNGVTLTINGILATEEDIYAQCMFDLAAKNNAETAAGEKSSAIVVNGALYLPATYDVYGYNAQTSAGNYPAKALSAKAPIAGAYYATEENKVISSLAYALYEVDEVVGSITINGAVKESNLIFAATDACDEIVIGLNLEKDTTHVRYATSLTVDSLLLSGSKITAKPTGANGASYSALTGTIGNVNGVVDFVDAVQRTSNAADLTFSITDKEGKLILTGNYDIEDKGDAFEIVSGTVYADNITVVAKTVANSYSTKLIVDEGAKLESRGTTAGSISDLLVYGSLSVPNTYALAATTITLYGDMDVAAATSSKTSGTLTVTNLYVGIDDASFTKGGVAATASVSGKFTLSANCLVVVLDGSTIDDAAAAVLDAVDYSTTMYVEGSLWFTAYTNGAEITLKVPAVPVEDATLKGWASYEGGSAIDFNPGGIADDDYVKFTIKDYETLYAVINYEIYAVFIKTDAGIKEISLNGKLMESPASGENVFELADLRAGVYKVTYTLMNGYQGTATLKTSEGTILQGNSFELTGKPVDQYVAGYYVFEYQLNGTEPIPEPEPTPTPEEKSEWTITTILLVILVILIAIMAVIVALRLNRN